MRFYTPPQSRRKSGVICRRVRSVGRTPGAKGSDTESAP